MSITKLENQIFNVQKENFEDLALAFLKYQAKNNIIYNRYLHAISCNLELINSIIGIPFLPIQFFKTHKIISGVENKQDNCFESSGTTSQLSSKHFVSDIAMYEKSFLQSFTNTFGSPSQYCILGLLPSYLERRNSSLVYMVDHLSKLSQHTQNGFYLNNYQDLHNTLLQLESTLQPSIIFGVTYALLDFADKYSMPLRYTKIIETGGMKGRHEELIRDEVHAILKQAFSMNTIHSEYGMTELLSQAYSNEDGTFQCPNWMCVMVRDMNDPLQHHKSGKGLLSIIDLANIHSCCFIATDDVGEVFDDGRFIVNGRLDHSELRGCSLMAL